MSRTPIQILLASLIMPWLIGCTPEAEFRFNSVYALKQEKEFKAELDTKRRFEIGNILVAMFGTPDEPHVPSLAGVDTGAVMDPNKLHFAAGKVGRDKRQRMRGLYREHCAHCHGVTGDGAGPTAAFLNPYPRDYRMGIFKFKSTPIGVKPTHADLTRILMEGVAGTAMPSFKVLPENEVEALVHYVRYLAIRGEVERSLLNYVSTELDVEDSLIDMSVNANSDAKAEQAEILNSFVVDVVEKWIRAEKMVTPVPAPDPQRDHDESIVRGRNLFYGAVALCAKCHGDSQLGDGQVTDYDKWAEELSPKDPDILEDYLALPGALPPRNIRPRNLRVGVYRGGRRPIDVYWRIRNGIDGTPMPAAVLRPEGAAPDVKGLTEEDIWCLIDFVRSLPYESVSHPAMPDAGFQRERM
jgi:mono/diheme cytochrome c family protein